MRLIKTSLMIATAVCVAAAPVVAQAATPSANPLSVGAVKRAGTPAKAENKLGGGSGTIVAIVAAVAVIAGIIVIADNGSKSP